MNSTPGEVDGSMFSALELSCEILVVISFLSYIPVYILTYSYFRNISLAKECLLLHLYKDLITNILIWRTLWLTEVIVRHLSAEGPSEILAMILSFGLWCALLNLALNLLFICIYKLYMSKTGTIDPTISWLGNEETTEIRRIRIGCCLLVLAFLATTFAMGLNPVIFYQMTHQSQEKDLLISIIVYRGSLILLFVLSGILAAATKLYGTKDGLTVDQIISKTISYSFVLAAVMLIVISVLQSFQFSDIRMNWRIYQIIITPIQIFLPFVIMFGSKPLKLHSIRFLRNTYDSVFMLSIHLVPMFLFIVINLMMYVLF